MRVLIVVVLCCILAACICTTVQGHQIPVSVYYESLCPDSKKFFTSQLYPSLLNPNISQLVNLTLVPYGKSAKNLVDDQWQFTCHHGPYECQGNKIQACAIHVIEATAPKKPEQGFNPVTVALINCLMDKAENVTGPGNESHYNFHLDNCSEINHVPNYMQIDNCHKHTDGSQYLAEYGDLTEKLDPALKSVPTIIFDGKFNKEHSDLAQTNFVKALCKYVHHDMPLECKDSAASLTLSMMAVVFMLLKQLF